MHGLHLFFRRRQRGYLPPRRHRHPQISNHGGRAVLGRRARADHGRRPLSPDHALHPHRRSVVRIGRIVSDSVQKPHGFFRYPRRIGRSRLRRGVRHVEQLRMVGNTNLRILLRNARRHRRIPHRHRLRQAESHRPRLGGRRGIELFSSTHLHNKDGGRYRLRSTLDHVLAHGKPE